MLDPTVNCHNKKQRKQFFLKMTKYFFCVCLMAVYLTNTLKCASMATEFVIDKVKECDIPEGLVLSIQVIEFGTFGENYKVKFNFCIV
jgi:hypothetical protein